MMVSGSYILAALSMYAAGLYLIYRLRPYLTSSSMLLGLLLLIHGPAYLVYMLARGSQSSIYTRIEMSPNFEGVVIALNVSMALMFLGVMTGFEIVNLSMRSRACKLQSKIAAWNLQKIDGAILGYRFLWMVVLGLIVFMLWSAVADKQISAILGYVAVSGDEFAKIAYRQQYGGSSSYIYRIVVGFVAPMLIIWGALGAWRVRSCLLAAVTAVLFALTVLGKLATLSKAPIALFLLQILLAFYLVHRNSINKRAILIATIVGIAIFYPVIRLAIPNADAWDALSFFYYRTFDVSNEAVLEFFGAFPGKIGHLWGANIRLLATVLGMDYQPSFEVVSRLWRGSGGSTTTALFIADAWADFSYFGVFGFSVLLGSICRISDVLFVAEGKTVISVVILSAMFLGIYNALISALPTAALSGGLVLPAVFAFAAMRVDQITRSRSAPA
jgi:oligosaccharide repeat unit polymerase